MRLPAQRERPLPVGGAKETQYLHQLESKLHTIAQKNVQRYALESSKHAEEQKAYLHFSEMAKDFEEVVGLIWVVKTPSLQVQQLLALQSTLLDYLPGFEADLDAGQENEDSPQPKALFDLLGMFDEAFATLVEQGQIRGTELVRLRNLVNTVRSTVFKIMKSSDGDEEEQEDEGIEMESSESGFGDDEEDGMMDEEEASSRDMAIAAVMEKTIYAIGEGVE